MTGKDSVFLGLISEDFEDDENAVVVTTTRSAASLYRSLDADERLGVVEFGPELSTDTTGTRLVSSPGDLTGLSMALSDLTGETTGPYRLGFDDVSPFVMYTDFDRTYRFLNTVTDTVRSDGALGVFAVESDAIREKDLPPLRELFDAVVEFRERGKTSEYRAIAPEETTYWSRVPEMEVATHGLEQDTSPGGYGFESLEEFLEGLEDETITVSVYNPASTDTADTDPVTALSEYFEELGPEVLVKTSAELPDSLVTLEKGGEAIAAEHLDDVLRSVHARTASSDEDYFEPVDSDFLRRAESFIHGFGIADKLKLIRISRTIEARAWTAGVGELHTGFQRLSLFDDQKELYERMAERGAEVHVYGEPDAEPTAPGVEVHPSPSEEISQNWFVVLSGVDAPGTLLAHDIGDNEYHARWTYSREYADAVRNYLVSEY